MLPLLCASLPTSKKLPKQHAAYRRALLRELGIPGLNLTHGEGNLLHAAEPFDPGALLLVIPPKYVLTVQEALGSGAGSLINKNARKLRRTLPRHFVLAMWVLYTKHVSKRRDDLWYLWLASLPRFDTCPVFWGEDELRMLEEERALKRSRGTRPTCGSQSPDYQQTAPELLLTCASPVSAQRASGCSPTSTRAW